MSQATSFSAADNSSVCHQPLSSVAIPPAITIPMYSAIHDGELRIAMPTRSPFATPRTTSACATPVAAAYTSAKVSRSSPATRKVAPACSPAKCAKYAPSVGGAAAITGSDRP